MAKPGVMFYFDVRPCIKRLDTTEKGMLFEAILDYGEFGSVPEFDGVLGIAWDFIQPRLDKDAGRYDKQVEQRQYAVYAREMKKKEQTPLSFDEWRMQYSNERNRTPSDDNGSYPTSTNNLQLHPQLTTSTSIYNKADKPPAPTKKVFSKYGWVKLTQEEYDRLVTDLGETEVKRCVDYVDESAQSTNNKNKWRDWNLVIRRCSRYGWGKSIPQKGGRDSRIPDYGGEENWSL